MSKIIRVSAAGLARIVIEDKHLLLLNKNSLKKGKRIFKPIGGVIEYQDPAREFLEDTLGARDFEKGKDLRFKMPENNWSSFLDWFYTKQDRETDPYRELQEELTDEAQILPFVVDDEDCRVKSAGIITEKETTDRTGQEGVLTYRVMEIFDTSFWETFEGFLIDAAEDPSTSVGLFTSEEINNLKTNEGEKIGTNSKYVLKDRKYS